ncbi:hypothetical protein AJ79_01908 [Helicocarpus griseus UAMH5409]|uniref:Uncharacterized protein n=1 Tax=Helicocarpus griseus UAMH5409 TaxID=1447875 RepID=A0A2B7Y573_9EURO|nr:hypothetical protein AJ79_01908 [Helicocarpus griseus UAMH5409]
MAACKFFKQGRCMKGEACSFIHDRGRGTEAGAISGSRKENRREDIDPILPVGEPALKVCRVSAIPRNDNEGGASTTQICTFFMRGLCSRGDGCLFVHPPATTMVTPLQQAHQDSAISSDTYAGQQVESKNSSRAPADSDSRATVPCRFLSRPGGCRSGLACPYFHDGAERKEGGHGVGKDSSQDFEANSDEAHDQERDCDDDFTRDLAGASVSFDEHGHVHKVSLPSDFSLARITGLRPGTTCNAIVTLLDNLGLNVDVDCVCIRAGRTDSSSDPAVTATVKVEDPSFARDLSAKLKGDKSGLSATPIPLSSRRTNCRKVYISWHKATRSAWVNFGNGDIANGVARKFNDGAYKCFGASVRSSEARDSQGGRSGGLFSSRCNPVAWTITLSDVPGNATSTNIQEAIRSPYDKPRHVEMGAASYQASDAEVSVDVRSRLEEHGPLESFYMAPVTRGKRVKATAWFQDEADARSACSMLDNVTLGILGKCKLTVTLVQSVKVKVFTTVYSSLKGIIEREINVWKEKHLALHVYPDAVERFTTLKIEGGNARDVTNARKALDEILSGVVLTDGEGGSNAVWNPALNSNGTAYRKLKVIEKALDVVIVRDKARCQLRFYGPPEKLQQAVQRVSDMLDEETSTNRCYEIDLKPHQFSWAMHGGFKSIEHAVGKNVVVFNVVSRRITINGTQQQYEAALNTIAGGKHAVEIRSPSENSIIPVSEKYCPICFCEADPPIQTSCKHTYCLDCFEATCKSASSTSKDQFRIACQGDEGNCPAVFTLRELKEHLSSSVFESVLQSSFGEYIQRHPEAFHYCPTPDCGFIYRCTTTTSSLSSKSPVAYTCPNCLEPLCTACHARHGGYTCAEYKDIASGGVAALEKLKRELNIKACPKCGTLMEKTEGCNHMTCRGCRAHICWVCMSVFETSGGCYEHMQRVHGGIGLGLERFQW